MTKQPKFTQVEAVAEANELGYDDVRGWAEDYEYVYCDRCECYVWAEKAGHDGQHWTCNQCADEGIQ